MPSRILKLIDPGTLEKVLGGIIYLQVWVCVRDPLKGLDNSLPQDVVVALKMIVVPAECTPDHLPLQAEGEDAVCRGRCDRLSQMKVGGWDARSLDDT